jgi:hypothetical protein
MTSIWSAICSSVTSPVPSSAVMTWTYVEIVIVLCLLRSPFFVSTPDSTSRST